MSIKLVYSALLIFILFQSNISYGNTFKSGKVSFDKKLQHSLEAYDVSWDSLGFYSAQSMPLGNGDIALNVWTEQNGDVLFYISKSDAWSEAGNLVKLGRVRVSLTPNPFTNSAPFQQVLYLKDSKIQISGGTGLQKTTLTIWVDANQPVIRVEGKSISPRDFSISLETLSRSTISLILNQHFKRNSLTAHC